jgi:4-amino-4-deoxy-L-arabinose transferase-like glycosyltransferase
MSITSPFTHTEYKGKNYWLVVLLLVGFALRVVYVTEDRFHADEALYAGWALRALDGDSYLLTVPIDKPPLYLYTLATSMWVFGRSEVAARLPNLAASIVSVILTYKLGQRLYGPKAAWYAAFFTAFSPFDILFARTAFTDPMLVMWEMLALYTTITNRNLAAGLSVGMAFATKQHAVLFFPLLAAITFAHESHQKRMQTPRVLFLFAKRQLYTLAGMLIPLALVTWWDSRRWHLRPGYWQQSTMSYGGLHWTPWAEWIPRLIEWLGWAQYLVGSLFMYLAFIIGTSALLITALSRRSRNWQSKVDILLTVYGAGYLIVHTVLQFSIWDRYLLPLVPLVSLVLARILLRTDSYLAHLTIRSRKPWLSSLQMLAPLLVLSSLVFSGSKAALNGYPVGGEHWAYQGIDQITLYLKQHTPPDAILYHHWLRWHYSYYLYGAELELRWWQSGEHLRREVLSSLDREQYIVLPDWRTTDPLTDGIRLDPISVAYRKDGSISLHLYRIEPTGW